MSTPCLPVSHEQISVDINKASGCRELHPQPTHDTPPPADTTDRAPSCRRPRCTLRLRETHPPPNRPKMNNLRVLTGRSPPRSEHEYRLLTSPRRTGPSMLLFASVFFVAGVLLGGTWTSLVPPPTAPHATSLDNMSTATGLDPNSGDSTESRDAATPLSIAWLMTFPSKCYKAKLRFNSGRKVSTPAT